MGLGRHGPGSEQIRPHDRKRTFLQLAGNKETLKMIPFVKSVKILQSDVIVNEFNYEYYRAFCS